MPPKTILLNPGPTNVSRRVLDAASSPQMCHREPEYGNLQEEVRARLLSVLGLDGETWSPVLIAGSGTSGLEAMVATGVPEGKALAVSVNGVYGDRIAKMARAHGIVTVEIEQPWGVPADPALIRSRLETRDHIGALAVVHHETTTGHLNPVEEIGALAKELGHTYLVDSVSGLAGDELDLDRAGVDYCASTGGKNYQGLVGVSFVYARREALARARKGQRRSVYLDLVNLSDHQDKRGTPFTPVVPLVAALREALVELEEETVPGRIARYRDAALFLREGYAKLGLSPWLPEGSPMSNCLTTIRLPEGRTYDSVHDFLKDRGFVIYAGQGDLGKEAFRICNMGWVDRADYERLLDVLGEWVRS
jgi:2-aminoethylphosphonate-pyruvate transaminase